MANLTITNLDTGSVGLEDLRSEDDTLNLAGAQTVAEGTILARDSVSSKLVLFVPGGAALVSTSDGTFNLTAGATIVLDINNAGNETATFDAAAATILDTTTYTGGTAATITDTTTYAVTDQDGLTSLVTLKGVLQTVTFAGATTTAALVAAQMNDQLTGISAVVTGGQVVLTTDEGGVDVTLTVAAGTGGLTWAAPTPGAGGLADQDGLTSVITLSGGDYDAEVQTVTFAGVTTELAEVVAQMNAQLKGCSVAASGGQALITHDVKGTSADITAAAGTGGLTWAASTAGTGDVTDIDAVTATEVKTVVEADTTATVTVVGDAAVFKATVEIEFVSGAALTPMGLSAGVTTANENGIVKTVLQYELTGANGDNYVRPMVSGGVRTERLVVADGSSVTAAMLDALRSYSIIPRSVNELGRLDNQ